MACELTTNFISRSCLSSGFDILPVSLEHFEQCLPSDFGREAPSIYPIQSYFERLVVFDHLSKLASVTNPRYQSASGISHITQTPELLDLSSLCVASDHQFTKKSDFNLCLENYFPNYDIYSTIFT